MTATNHAVTGILVAVAIKQPALALPAAFLSHFVLDVIPHWSHQFKNQLYTQISVVIDLALAAILTIILALTLDASMSLVVAASLLGMSPDVLWVTEFGGPKLGAIRNKTRWNKFRWFLHTIQWSETSWGFFVEVAWLISVLTILFKNFT